MPVRRGLVVLFLFVAVSASSLAQDLIPLSEREALIALYNSTNGPKWLYATNWLGPHGTEGTWSGVVVNDGHVTQLQLTGRNLTGPLPPEIGDLPYLETFNAGVSGGFTPWHNYITALPPQIGKLSRLDTLNLTSNKIESLPTEIGELQNLRTLVLSSNPIANLPGTVWSLASLVSLNLSGIAFTELPAAVEGLTSLEILSLYNCKLPSLPPEIGNLSRLRELQLAGNQLTSLPAELGHLLNLEVLGIGRNPLQQVPPELGNLPRLRVLNLSYHQAPLHTGIGALKNVTELLAYGLSSLSPEVGQMSGLRVLELSDGELDSLPAEIGNLANLEILDLDRNDFPAIPPVIGQLTNLVEFSIDSNPLEGTIPASLGNLRKLKSLALFNTELSGQIPPELGNMESLESLWLGGDFQGPVPPELGRLTKLRGLGLIGNFSSLPGELGNLTNLVSLRLEGSYSVVPPELGQLLVLESLRLNSSGEARIPPELGQLAQLRSMDIHGGFTGTIPVALLRMSNLESLNLSGNKLTGPLPPDLAALTSLDYLDFSDNLLEGPLPPELGALNVSRLALSENRFSGTIPGTLGGMSRLTRLYLNNNQLEGRLPAELAALVKKTPVCNLSLASNRLTGAIPDEFGTSEAPPEGGRWSPFVDFAYNGLYANHPDVFNFIGLHHWYDFASTQSAGPFSLTVEQVTGNSVRLSWIPISYAADNGGYEVLYRKDSDGPLTVYAMTPDKTVNSVTVTGLETGTTYSFILRTITYPHAKNQNTVVGEPARFVTASTAQAAEAWFPFAPSVGQSAGLGITNPGTGEMKVQISALNPAGTLLPLPANPASFAIPPGRHLAAMTPQIFGSEPLAPAWIRVAADQTLVSLGMIQGPGYLDGIPGFTSLHKVLYFPRVYSSSIEQPPGPVTTISLVNPGDGPVQVKLELRGHEVAQAPVTRTIPPRGQLWETIGSLFAEQSFGQVYLLATVTEGEGVAGIAMVSAGGGRSLYVVPGQPLSGASWLFCAQVASGPGIRTSFRLVNASAEPRTVT
ncbi:MAG: hypothetical protein EHM18_01090, partial [Acidobacteria bacterium]